MELACYFSPLKIGRKSVGWYRQQILVLENKNPHRETSELVKNNFYYSGHIIDASNL